MIVQTRSAVIAAAALAFALAAPAAFAQQSGTSGDSGSMAMHNKGKDAAMSHSGMSNSDKMKGSSMARSGTSGDSAMSHDGGSMSKDAMTK